MDVKCPAAELQNPVLSPNPVDVECRIAGKLRPAKDSPCCGDYANCPIWKTHKQTMDRNGSVFVDEAARARATHTLSGDREREVVRAGV